MATEQWIGADYHPLLVITRPCPAAWNVCFCWQCTHVIAQDEMKYFNSAMNWFRRLDFFFTVKESLDWTLEQEANNMWQSQHASELTSLATLAKRRHQRNIFGPKKHNLLVTAELYPLLPLPAIFGALLSAIVSFFFMSSNSFTRLSLSVCRCKRNDFENGCHATNKRPVHTELAGQWKPSIFPKRSSSTAHVGAGCFCCCVMHVLTMRCSKSR